MKVLTIPRVISGIGPAGRCVWCKTQTTTLKRVDGRELAHCCSDACAHSALVWLPRAA